VEGPEAAEKPSGLGIVRFIAQCPDRLPEVLEKSITVLKIMNEHCTGEWPSDQKWTKLLPTWFVSRCVPQQSIEQTEQWLAWWKALPPEEQSRVEEEKDWSLPNWTYWFQPHNRQWYWWDAEALDDDTLIVSVEVDAWPFSWGSLRWLLLAAGADRVDAEV
jgi:hypothetical protein